jgi:hypothetical protein
MWNGAAPNLKAMPTSTNTTPSRNRLCSASSSSEAKRMLAMSRLPVAP